MLSVVFETFVFISSDAECNGFNHVTLREKTISQDGTVPDLTGKNFVINHSNPPQQAYRAQTVRLQKKWLTNTETKMLNFRSILKHIWIKHDPTFF